MSKKHIAYMLLGFSHVYAYADEQPIVSTVGQEINKSSKTNMEGDFSVFHKGGFYLGGEVGINTYEDKNVTSGLSGTMLGLSLGYVFDDFLYGMDWYTEASYIFTEPVKYNAIKGETNLATLSLGARFPIYNDKTIDLDFGGAYWTTTKTVDGNSNPIDASGISPLISIGINVPLTKRLSTKVSYEYVHNIGSRKTFYADKNLLSLGIYWHFNNSDINKEAPAKVKTDVKGELNYQKIKDSPVDNKSIEFDSSGVAKLYISSESFDFGSSDLKSVNTLDEVVLFLNKNKDATIKLIGHTDNVGSSKTNTALSIERAKSVYRYIINRGIDFTRLSYEGVGESQPLVPNTSEFNRSKNRRVDILVNCLSCLGGN